MEMATNFEAVSLVEHTIKLNVINQIITNLKDNSWLWHLPKLFGK